jgi:hypothetical protein
MANKEMQLISRVIHTGELNTVIDWGITAEDFLTNEGRAMFNHLVGYYTSMGSSGSVIGPQAMAHFYPNFLRCDDYTMTLSALCYEVRKQRLAIECQHRLGQVQQLLNHDPIEALNMLNLATTELNSVGLGKNNDRSLGPAFNAIHSQYQLRKSGVDMSWGRWPWLPLQEATRGLQQDDYICFYGRPKSMKSWVLSYFVAWLFNSGRRVLIYTKEMTQDNIFMRVIACIAEIAYQDFRAGSLTPEEEFAFTAVGRYINAMRASEQIIVLSGRDAPKGGDTVPWLRAKIEKYRPEMFAIDGLYLMSDVYKARKDHERVRNISRDIRQMIFDTGVPGLVTLQANRAAAKNEDANLDEVAFSDSISQDCTTIIRVINEKEEPTIQLVVGGSREWALNGIRINAIPAQDFTFRSLLTSKEIQKAKEKDGEAEDNPQAHVRKKSPTEASALRTLNQRIAQANGH